MSKEVNIDIGGGEGGEFFVGLAARDHNSLYIVLDPKKFRCSYIDLYPNLRLIRWSSGRAKNGNNWELPFQDASLDKVYLNNIYGVMEEAPVSTIDPYDKNQPTRFDDKGRDIYSRVVSSVRRVIKPTGITHVKETQGLIPIVKQIFLDKGFKIIDGPRSSRPTDFTATSVMLLKFAEEDVEKYKINRVDESLFLPMEFTASLASVQQ